jgi:hypothetical protein
MKLFFPRLILAALGTGLLLAGCASHPSRTPASGTGNAPTTAPESQQALAGSQAGHEHRAPAAATGTPATSAALPDNTGIPACDDYLASYLACHRAAAIYRPDQLQGRYEAMRTSLLRDSQDPKIRPILAARCNSLASQLRQALHGKSCDSTPAESSSQNVH